ncbi:hypothetical protein GCM10009840_01290 [Pseudolysinimonas kribbensis]|uniref:Aminoglycoside nucleotidyltransferase n=1 Tax=Pseudolysinimonas kribbensis TaxID=433641 RepID=A0ABQ6K1Q6_9MICO|nr:amino acid transporter [Pseudolysinimonas kribbensis]GMA94403.1 aminoglycoside nucleotidyltransferase [Pseudolysinimonas kribbensis]
MTEAEVLRVLAALDGLGVHVDGGWGVDALLGRQTRQHGDLDLAVPIASEERMESALVALGYRAQPGHPEHNPVFASPDGAVDVHLYEFAGDEPEALIGIAYPRASLTGRGRIGGVEVDCIAAEWVIPFHSGYPLDADDLADVRAVAEAFGLDLLPEQREL